VIFVYASSPTREVLGTVHLGSISRLPPREVWSTFGTQIEISRDDLSDYLHGSEEAAIIQVDQPHTWHHPVSLQDLRAHVGIEPAQSFRYLDSAQAETLTTLGTQARVDEDIALLSPAP
jgi:predicted transcriptional regulator